MAMLDLAGNGKEMDNRAAIEELSAFLKTTGKFTENIFPALATMDRDIVNPKSRNWAAKLTKFMPHFLLANRTSEKLVEANVRGC